jgi:hypothetical protein
MLKNYNLSPDALWGRLESFHHNVVNIYFKLAETDGLKGIVVLEFGLLEPLYRAEIKEPYLAPLPKEILELIPALRGMPASELKKILHEDVLVAQSKGKKRIYQVSMPSDFMDPTYPSSNPRSRIVLNTIGYNKLASDSALENGIYEFRRQYYPEIDVETIPKNVLIGSSNVNQDFIEISRSKESEIFDFKGYQSCLFVYALACHFIHVIEGRWADEDEILELTQSRITLAELRKHFGNNQSEHALKRAGEYLRKRRHVERMVKKHLEKLVKLHVLQKMEKFSHNLYAISATSFTDKSGRTLWLPSIISLKKIHKENLTVWNQSPFLDIGNIPGEPQDRVFVGGPTLHLPTLRVIKSICISGGKQPILTYDFNLPNNDIYKSSIRLLLDCSYAIFEVSESAGQLFEIQKALEFGTPTLLLYRSDRQGMPIYISRMLLTLVHSHNVRPETYSCFEEMQEKIDRFFKSFVG